MCVCVFMYVLNNNTKIIFIIIAIEQAIKQLIPSLFYGKSELEYIIK